MKKLAAVIAVIMTSLGMIHAQQERPPLKLGFGMFGTAAVCDLNYDGETLYRFYPGFNASLQFASRKLVTPQFNVGYGKFVSQNGNLPMNDSIVTNTFVETGFFYGDFRLKAKAMRTRRVSPFASLGIGFISYNPKDMNGNSLADNYSTRAEGETYGTMTVAIPMSAGVEVRLSRLISVELQYTYRLTGSDYLDNIGQLGLRNGSDKLHSLQLGMFIVLDNDYQPPQGKDR